MAKCYRCGSGTISKITTIWYSGKSRTIRRVRLCENPGCIGEVEMSVETERLDQEVAV